MKAIIRQCAVCLGAAFMFLAAGSVWGWYEHPLLLFPVLQSMPGVAEAEPVAAKSLADFIMNNEGALVGSLCPGYCFGFRDEACPLCGQDYY